MTEPRDEEEQSQEDPDSWWEEWIQEESGGDPDVAQQLRDRSTYWTQWFAEHDTDAMIQEVCDLSGELHDARSAGWTDERIVKAGRRQAALIHDLLNAYTAQELADESGFSVDVIVRLNAHHLAVHGESPPRPGLN